MLAPDETAAPELLAMFRRRGYEFVTLDMALADDVYRLPEDYVGRNGFTWIHRWTRTQGLPIKPEPDPRHGSRKLGRIASSKTLDSPYSCRNASIGSTRAARRAGR